MAEAPVGVLLMAYGTPDTLADVEPYYAHIRGGRQPPPELLHQLIERYQAIGGPSPLTAITRRQAAGLERLLNREGGTRFRAYVGMKHWHPYIADTVAQMAADGICQAVALTLAPHYSAMSVGVYNRTAAAAAATPPAATPPAATPPVATALAATAASPAPAAPAGGPVPSQPLQLACVDSWHVHPGLVRALARRVQFALDSFSGPERMGVEVFFTAHSLPASILEQGDPYPNQLRETAAAVAAAAGVQRWDVAWQSAGRTPFPWLGPDIKEVLAQRRQRGLQAALICPAGFVADHLEVLYDIDIECQDLAARLGMHVERTPSLNDSADFLAILADVVTHQAQEAGFR